MEFSLSRRSFISAAACAAAGLAIAGRASFAPQAARADEAQTITITALDAAGEPAEIEVPFDPQRLAMLDMACLDIVDNLGLGERVVGIADTHMEYLSAYTDAGLNTLGTVKEADLEAVMACEPDVIFIGGRLASSFDALSEIAPVVYLSTDVEKGVVASTTENARTIASMFGLESQIDELTADFDERIAALSEFAAGKTAVVGMCTSGSFNVLGNDGRCSIIGREIGFDNVAAGQASSGGQGGGRGGNGGGEGGQGGRGGQGGEGGSASADGAADSAASEGQGQGGQGGGQAIAEVTATHGNEASFETIVSLDPDYIFVMDRDAAIGTEGAQMAQEIMDNELVNSTRAAQDGHLVFLEHPAMWYTAEGGITALGYMLSDLEAGLGLAEGAAE